MKKRLNPMETMPLASEPNTEGDFDGTFRIGPSLYLQRRGDNQSWLFWWKRDGKTRWMGLASYGEVKQA